MPIEFIGDHSARLPQNARSCFLPPPPPRHVRKTYVANIFESYNVANTAHIAIREYDAKLVLGYWLPRSPSLSGGKPETDLATPFIYPTPNVAQIAWDEATNTITPDTQTPQWVFTSKLVAKPDQLIKRRGKAGLLALNKTWPEAKEWIAERAGKPVQVRPDPRVPPPSVLFLFLSF